MSALRSALVDVLRGLPDAEIARVVRAAPAEALRPLVQVALDLDGEPAAQPGWTGADAVVSEPAPERAARRAPRTKATEEDAPGSRPTPAGERLLVLLKRGPRTTAELAEKLGVSTTRTSQLVRKLVDLGSVRATKQPGRGGQLLVEAT